MKTRILPFLLLLLAGGAPCVFAQNDPGDAYFFNWLERWNKAFSPLDTVAVSAMLPDDFRYYWTNQADAPHAFGELATKAEFMSCVVIESQGWQTLALKNIGNYPGEVDNYARRSTDGQIVWLHSHHKEIFSFKEGGKTKIDSAYSAACYTFQRREGGWMPVHAFACYYNVKKTRSYGGLYQEVEVAALAGKKFILTVAIKTDFPEDGGTAYLWARVNKMDGSPGFFQNTWDKPILQKDWQSFSIEGILDGDAAKLTIGCGVRLPGVAWFDDFHLKVEERPGIWNEIPLSNSDFEDPAWNGKYPKGWQGTSIDFLNFSNSFTDKAPFRGKHSFEISGKPE